MTRTSAIDDPDSCWNKAQPHEPVFVLTAHDYSALIAVKAWIDHRIHSGQNRADDPKIIDARNWLNDAIHWRNTTEDVHN